MSILLPTWALVAESRPRPAREESGRVSELSVESEVQGLPLEASPTCACYVRLGPMLALAEYIMHEPLPLATVQEAILGYCRGRRDLCVFGAQALSIHTGVPRMTQDVDIMAEDPRATADQLAVFLSERFPHHMAARVRVIRRGDHVLGYRVYQQRSDERGGNRHLADLRALDVPREALETSEGIQYTGPELTLAMKTHAATVRSNTIKRGQDRVDTLRLMRAMPDTSAAELESLWVALGAPPEVRRTFEELSDEARDSAETDEDDFY